MTEIDLVDLDSVEIVREVERAFQIKIGIAEAEACATMGDLFAVVLAKIPTVARGAIPCPTALAFWRLRKAMRDIAPGKPISPTTPIADLMPASGHRRWWRDLQRSTGLVMPSSKPKTHDRRSRNSLPVLAALLLSSLPFIFGAGAWSILAGATGGLLSALSRRRPDRDGSKAGATIGDLARVAASLNIGLLVQHTGSVRTQEAWQALEGVVRNFTDYPGPIDKRTRFRCK